VTIHRAISDPHSSAFTWIPPQGDKLMVIDVEDGDWWFARHLKTEKEGESFKQGVNEKY
jgi:hypothetical protein